MQLLLNACRILPTPVPQSNERAVVRGISELHFKIFHRRWSFFSTKMLSFK